MIAADLQVAAIIRHFFDLSEIKARIDPICTEAVHFNHASILLAMKTIYEPNYRKLIGWLTAERKHSNMNQQELATKLGYASHNFISKVETFEKKLGLMEYVKICQVIGLDPREGMEFLMDKEFISKLKSD